MDKGRNDVHDAMTSRMPDAADIVESTLDGIDNGREVMREDSREDRGTWRNFLRRI